MLIVGAGPTGLVLALLLTRLGVRVRIVDKVAEPGTTSRALAVQARTLELYRQLGLADAVVERGRGSPRVNLWVDGEQGRARRDSATWAQALSPFPYLLIFPQDEHERLLIERLAEARRRRSSAATDSPASTQPATACARSSRRPDGADRICDGGLPRRLRRRPLDRPRGAGDRLPRRHLRASFYVADVDARRGRRSNGELHVALDDADFLAVFPLKGDGRARLIGTVRDDARPARRALTWDDVEHSA